MPAKAPARTARRRAAPASCASRGPQAGSAPPAGRAPRAIVVHRLAEAEAALRAAASLDRPVALWSAEGAAAYAGAGWFKAVIEAARASVPAARATAVLDCAELPGLVLGAWRIGLEAACFTGPSAVARKLAEIAAQQGCRLLRRRPRALDLRHHPRPEAACRDWLRRG